MAKAMALAKKTPEISPLVWADQKTHCVFPPTEIKLGQGLCQHSNRRPAPAPVGEKRPPVAGRALAGGFGPPAVQRCEPDMAKAMALAN